MSLECQYLSTMSMETQAAFRSATHGRNIVNLSCHCAQKSNYSIVRCVSYCVITMTHNSLKPCWISHTIWSLQSTNICDGLEEMFSDKIAFKTAKSFELHMHELPIYLEAYLALTCGSRSKFKAHASRIHPSLINGCVFF